jgi:hypothetical protein
MLATEDNSSQENFISFHNFIAGRYLATKFCSPYRVLSISVAIATIWTAMPSTVGIFYASFITICRITRGRDVGFVCSLSAEVGFRTHASSVSFHTYANQQQKKTIGNLEKFVIKLGILIYDNYVLCNFQDKPGALIQTHEEKQQRTSSWKTQISLTCNKESCNRLI